MAIIPLPAKFGFSSIPTFKLMRSSIQSRGKYSGARQAIVFPYAVWQLEGDLVETVGAQAGAIRSFLVQLDGVANKFRLPIPGYRLPLTGYAANATAYVGAAARAQGMTLTGLAPNTPIFGDGDYITVNDECKMITAPIASDGNGRAIISFKPGLRAPVAPGTAVVIVNPTILMNALDDDVANWTIRAPIRQSGKFRAIEAIEA